MLSALSQTQSLTHICKPLLALCDDPAYQHSDCIDLVILCHQSSVTAEVLSMERQAAQANLLVEPSGHEQLCDIVVIL